ncbi:MAG: NusG domain II-containing protein [Desulfobacterales bacterium]
MKDDPIDIPKLSRASRLDVVLIGLALSFSVAAILWTSGGDRTALPVAKNIDIYHANRLVNTIDFSEDKVIALPGVGMEIEVLDGKVRVVKSDCPRQICVNMGWIQHPGDTIVCVPNRVLIEIGSSGTPMMDAVVS